MADPRTPRVALVEAQLPSYRCPDIHQLTGKRGKRLMLLRREPIGQAEMQPVLQSQRILPSRRVGDAREGGDQRFQPWTV